MPQRLEVRGPAKAKPGIDAVFTVLVRGADQPVDSLFPLHLAVTDPAGQTSREYSRRLLARHGIAEERLRFAVNDAPGTWTLAVTDAMTRLSAKATIELAK
ncbi:MAG: hypothetical protein HYU66_22700 [Armatimonadetes bacterium]|nr:hypothetical protein [Armatimonadota bacterium]